MKKSTLWLKMAAGTSTALSLSPLALAQERLSNKTPDGMAYSIKPDDVALGLNLTPQKPTLTAVPDPALVQAAARLIDDSLTAMAVKADEKDTQWYENGVWKNNTENVWQVQSGPAVAAAALWKWRNQHKATLDAATLARQEWLHKVAVETFDRNLADRQKPDGTMPGTGTHVQFFAADLGRAYLTLGDSLDQATQTRWREALVKLTDAFIRNGDLPDASKTQWKATDGWTTNGNVEFYEAELAYLTWKVTGDQKYKDLYEAQWKHTLSPSLVRWKGYGLYYLKEPLRLDGSDGMAFVCEAEPEPGFDPEYTQLQLSCLSRLYVESGDSRVLRVMNLLINALMPRIDENTWILDATYGSRHSTRGPLLTAAPEVAAWLGNRADLIPKISGHFEKALRIPYLRNAQMNQGAPGLYRGYGVDLAVLLDAASVEKPKG